MEWKRLPLCHSNRCGHVGRWPIIIHLILYDFSHGSSLQRTMAEIFAPSLCRGRHSRFSLRDIGSKSHLLGGDQSPGGGSISLEALLRSRLYTRSPISALMVRGTECSSRTRSHASVSSNLHLWFSSMHSMPSSWSQYFGTSERIWMGRLANGKWIHKCWSRIRWEFKPENSRAPVGCALR